MKETADLWRELLAIPDTHQVLLLGGGQYPVFHRAGQLDEEESGLPADRHLAKKAIKEAKLFGEVEIVASSEDKNFTYIPKEYTIPEDADYFHITSNNTIFGPNCMRILTARYRWWPICRLTS